MKNFSKKNIERFEFALSTVLTAFPPYSAYQSRKANNGFMYLIEYSSCNNEQLLLDFSDNFSETQKKVDNFIHAMNSIIDDLFPDWGICACLYEEDYSSVCICRKDETKTV